MRVTVENYNHEWAKLYELEANRLRGILGENLEDIYHIGSTSVEGLKSKPIIDIMPVVKDITKVDKHNNEFEQLGYECMGEFGMPGRRYFRKGGDDRTHQIHIFEAANSCDVERHLAVRDYLRVNKDRAEEYGELKVDLAKKFPMDIEGYCDGKDEFVKSLERDAVEWYRITHAEPFFEGWDETLIWSCLQNVMGKVYLDNPIKPTAAMAILGDFCFFAGKPSEELVSFKPDWFEGNAIIMVPQNKAWGKLIKKCYGKAAKKITRYAIKKEQDVFDEKKLKEVVDTLPSEYTLKMIDEEIYNICNDLDWCRDWVSQFKDYEMFSKYALGAVVLKDGEPVSGASSYSAYNGGIEIEIDTREDYRRRGLAYVCGARLILECLERNLYPSWDAQNKWSVALSRKLGYHFDRKYTAYEVLEY